MVITMLDELRNQIREVDASIAELIARRLDLARRIGEEKVKLGLPVRDFATEKRVLETMDRHAERLGIDREILEGVVLQLIRGSVQLQSRNRVPLHSRGNLRAAVIGGDGHMGKWFEGFLSSRGYDVIIIEKDDDLRLSLESDLIVVSVPLDRTGEVLRRIAGENPRGIIIEVASLKSDFVDQIPEWIESGMRIACIHPMFGAEADLLAGQNLIVCESGCKEAEDAAADLFSDSAVHVVRIPLADHDRIMAWVLNLPHLLNLLAADLLSASTEDHERLREFGGTTFNRQHAVTSEVVSENPDLYYHIQHINRHRGEFFNHFRESLQRIIGVIERNDREAFVKQMNGWSRWFRGER
ncbi:MAG: prephenate dehydrogenase/arogenate dehydrogenase family protein [bacterium]